MYLKLTLCNIKCCQSIHFKFMISNALTNVYKSFQHALIRDLFIYYGMTALQQPVFASVGVHCRINPSWYGGPSTCVSVCVCFSMCVVSVCVCVFDMTVWNTLTRSAHNLFHSCRPIGGLCVTSSGLCFVSPDLRLAQGFLLVRVCTELNMCAFVDVSVCVVQGVGQ